MYIYDASHEILWQMELFSTNPVLSVSAASNVDLCTHTMCRRDSLGSGDEAVRNYNYIIYRKVGIKLNMYIYT